MLIEYLNGGAEHHHGPIPLWLGDYPGARPLRDQLDAAYRHGGGWSPFGQGQWTIGKDNSIKYPGDPAHKPLAVITFDNHEETLIAYESAWFALISPDRTFEVCRMD